MIVELAMAAALTAPGKPATPECQIPIWRLMYRHDRDGRTLAGSKAELLNALRRGDPIRIAWGGAFKMKDGQTHSVEHAADPIFVTIINGEDVVAQVPEHIAQVAYDDEKMATFDSGAVMWGGLFSTTGRFDAVWVNRSTGQEVRRAPQRAAIAWMAFAPESRCDTRVPLGLAMEGGVVHRPPS